MRNVKGNVFKKIIAVMLTAATVLSPVGTVLSGVETVYATESEDYYRYELSDESVIFGKKSSITFVN